MQQHPHELASNWLAQARRDHDAARYLFAGKRFDAVCFSAQQAVEKALKGALIWLAGDRPRTHQIEQLVDEISHYRDDAKARLGDVAALDPYYVTTRYPDAAGGGVPGNKFFEPEASTALDRSARALAYVSEILAPPDAHVNGR